MDQDTDFLIARPHHEVHMHIERNVAINGYVLAWYNRIIRQSDFFFSLEQKRV